MQTAEKCGFALSLNKIDSSNDIDTTDDDANSEGVDNINADAGGDTTGGGGDGNMLDTVGGAIYDFADLYDNDYGGDGNITCSDIKVWSCAEECKPCVQAEVRALKKAAAQERSESLGFRHRRGESLSQLCHRLLSSL